MSSSINAITTGVGGVVTTADNSGILKLQTTGVDALTIDAAQKVTFAKTITPVVDSLNGGQLAGLRNRIINGDMRVAQRGVPIVPALGSLSAYSLDRWIAYQTGAAATFMQTGGNGSNNAYCLSFTGVASNTEVTVAQCIESINCYDLPTGAITASCWLYSTVAKTITLTLDTPTTTADVFSATTALPSGSLVYNHPGAGTWQQVTFTYSAALASTNAAAIRRGIRVRLGYGATTTGTFGITGVQLEIGTVATPFEQRPYGMELALCQRYYWQTIGLGGFMLPISSGDINPRNNFSFPVTMRATPTLTGTTALGTFTIWSSNTYGFSLYASGAGAGASTTMNNAYASAEL